MKIIFLFLLISVPLLQAQTVPSQYQAIYTNIQTQVSAFDSSLQHGVKYPYLAAPQLFSASSDLFTNLLNATEVQYQLIPELQSIQSLGAKAITIHIDFPILYQPFYTYLGGTNYYNQFVTFYQNVVTQAHNRGMKVIVETAAGTPFPGTLAYEYQNYYTTLKWGAYQAGRAYNASTILQLIKPDYLTVITEPDTEAINSGQANAGTTTGSLQLLTTIMNQINGKHGKTLVGAGAGTWITNYTTYVSNFLTQPIDFLDMHIYPVNKNFLMNAITGATMAHTAGKRVGMSECWDWKIADSELDEISLDEIEARSTFSFWAPVDQQFLSAIVDFANADQLDFIAPFWTHYFEAYLDYNTYGNDSYSTILTDSDTATSQAIATGEYTDTGTYFESLIVSTPDVTPPATPVAPTVTAGYTTANVTWPADSDNIGVAGYYIFRNGELISTVNNSVFYDTGLSNSTSYTYTMQAFDASNNVSAMSNPTTIKTYNSSQVKRKTLQK